MDNLSPKKIIIYVNANEVNEKILQSDWLKVVQIYQNTAV